MSFFSQFAILDAAAPPDRPVLILPATEKDPAFTVFVPYHDMKGLARLSQTPPLPGEDKMRTPRNEAEIEARIELREQHQAEHYASLAISRWEGLTPRNILRLVRMPRGKALGGEAWEKALEANDPIEFSVDAAAFLFRNTLHSDFRGKLSDAVVQGAYEGAATEKGKDASSGK